MRACALLLLLAQPVSAHAGCVAPRRLLSSVKICEDNHQYQEAGRACLAELETAVNKQRAATAAFLNRRIDDDKDHQAANFETAGAGYERTAADLSSLLARASETKSHLDAYRDAVVYPADWQDHSGSLLDALWSQACYAAAAGALDSNLDRVHRIATDLEAAREAAARLEGRSDSRLTGIAAKDPAASSGSKNAGTAAPAKAPRKPASRSTITGPTKKVTLPGGGGK